MLVLNRYQRRLLSRLRMNYPARERVPLTRAIDSLAMAGLVEYEASDFCSTKKNINQYVYVWLSPIPNRIHYSVCEMCTNRNEELLNTVDELEEDNILITRERDCLRNTIKELEQENTILQRKLEQRTELFGEHNWLASRTRKLVKENNMAKLDITVNELGAGDMAARGVSIIIDGISAEDAARVSLRLLSAIDPMEADDPETPQHVCTCHASDEDKRPPESIIRVMHHSGKTSGNRDNSFAPMDVE